MHIQGREGTENGGRFPARLVGSCSPAIPPGWVRPDGAERKTPDELARELREAVKPKPYAYDGRADAFPRATTQSETQAPSAGLLPAMKGEGSPGSQGLHPFRGATPL